MMHRVKKSFYKSTAPRADLLPSAAFLEYEQRLTLVKRNITLLDEKMTEANTWMSRQMIEQRSFSERFAEGYPNDLDETHAVAVEFRQGIGEVYDYYVRQTSPEVASYLKMQEQVKSYIKEIEEVEDTYRSLTDARAEVSRYQKKVDGIYMGKDHRHKTGPRADVKKTRNLEKLDAEREKLDELTRKIVTAQKRTFAKAPIVHKLALCAYWVAYRTHMDIMAQSLEKTEAFAVANEAAMSQLDISKISPDIPDEVAPVPVHQTTHAAQVPAQTASTRAAAADTIKPGKVEPKAVRPASKFEADAPVSGKVEPDAVRPAKAEPAAAQPTKADSPTVQPTKAEAVVDTQPTKTDPPLTSSQSFKARASNRLSKLRLGSSKAQVA